ncbi:MAG: RNA polymerase sigma factor [Bacteroidota bacterium]
MLYSDPNHVFDQLLVIDVQAGKSEALSLLAKRWHERIYQFALKQTKDRQAADDVAQEAWLAIQKGIFKLKDPAKFPSWALGITYRKSVDYIRNLQKERKQQLEIPRHESNDKDGLEVLQAQILHLREGIHTLPKKQRHTLELFYLDNYNLQEIAAILNIPEGTVKSRLFKARNRLKQYLVNQENRNRYG